VPDDLILTLRDVPVGMYCPLSPVLFDHGVDGNQGVGEEEVLRYIGQGAPFLGKFGG